MKRNLFRVLIACMIIAGVIISKSDATVVKAADYSNGGCVSWVKNRANEKLGITLPATGSYPSGVYGASNYWTVLPNYGYSKGSEPRANSLAVWGCCYGESGDLYGNYGHVAYVESVNGDNVEVTEGGVNGYSYNGNTGVIHRTQSKSAMATLGGCSYFLGYIYLQSTVIDTTAPVISDIKVTSHTANGYTVKCKVTDNIGVTKVQFPTWKSSGTSEGCTWYDGVIDGNTVTFTFSDATLEGDYTTHIYAWDAAGNSVSADVGWTYVDKTPPTISKVFVQGKNSKGYTVYCTVEDNVGVTNVKFPTWKASGTSDGCTWYDGVTNGNNATFTFKDAKEEGNYITHIYAYDASGNQSSVSVGDVYCCEDSIKPVVTKAEIVNMTDDEIVVHVEASDDKIIDDISFRTLLGFNDLIEPSIYQLRNKTTSVDVNEKVFSGDVTLKLADLNMDQTGEYCSIQVVASDGQNNGYLYTPIFKVPVWKTNEIEISVGENIDGFAIGKMIGVDMACYHCYYNEDEEVIRKQKDNVNIVFYAMNSGRESIYLLELSTGVIKCVTFNVVDKNVTKVSLNKTSAELNIGDTLQLTAKVSPDNATNKNVTWSSSDENIASVDETGLVTAKAYGTAVITVETEDGNKTASCTVTVKKESENVKLSSINATKKQTVYNAGEELNLSDISVTAVYSDNTTKPIAFSDCTSNAEELHMGTAGDKKLTIRYTENNAEATYDIAIKVLEKGSEGDKPSEDEPQQRMLSEITVQKEKSSYEQGEMVSLDDLVVKAVYSDGSNAVVTNYTTNISSLNTVTTGKKTLIVSYYEGGITKTAQVEITVTEKKGGNGSNTSDNKPIQSETSKVLTELTVKKTKTDYYIGDTLNLNDLSITAVYSDGTQKAVNYSDCDIQLDSSYYKMNGGKMVLIKCGIPSLYVIYEENGVNKVDEIYLYVKSKVKPAKVTGVKVKAKGSGKIYITWKKAKNADEYEVQIATKKNFKKGKKTNYTYSMKKMTWKKLKKGKIYYVRVRAYNYDSSKYGSWSTIKKIKVK